MIIVVGEILIDRFPDYERIGGAPFNFAFHLKSIGHPVRFITRIGDDPEGRSIYDMLTKNGFAPSDIQVDRRHPTGRVDVSLDAAGVPRFDICEGAAYDHIQLPAISAAMRKSLDMVYFGSLVQRTENGRQLVREVISMKPDKAMAFCDINLRPPHVHDAAIETCLEYADVLKLSAEELDDISSRCGGPSGGQDASDWLMQTHGIETLAVTRGEAGSYVKTPDGHFIASPVATATVVDTVGAGDAYAAVLAAGLLKDLPMDHTIEMATRFAADMCALPGAIPDDDELYVSIRNQIERNPNER